MRISFWKLVWPQPDLNSFKNFWSKLHLDILIAVRIKIAKKIQKKNKNPKN